MSSGERARRTGLGPPPDLVGHVERDGVRLAYKVFGQGDVTVLLLPTWQIIDSRFWKAQVGFLARHYRVITFDARGSGESDRPPGAAAYSDLECAADILAVLDATSLRTALEDDEGLAAVLYPRILRSVARRLEATRMQLLDLFGRDTDIPW